MQRKSKWEMAYERNLQEMDASQPRCVARCTLYDTKHMVCKKRVQGTFVSSSSLLDDIGYSHCVTLRCQSISSGSASERISRPKNLTLD